MTNVNISHILKATIHIAGINLISKGYMLLHHHWHAPAYLLLFQKETRQQRTITIISNSENETNMRIVIVS